VGFDAGLPAADLDGVFVHLLGSPTAAGPALIDQRPRPAGDAEDSSLPFDRPWTTPEGWTVTATAVSGGVQLRAAAPAVAAAPALSVNDVQVREGNKGTTSVSFTVTRTGTLTGPSSIAYRTVDGTAVAGQDYVAVSLRTLSFAAGDSAKRVTVVIKNDKKKEKKETFFLTLSKATGATVADPTGVATIADND
jgi:hypothetical protein